MSTTSPTMPPPATSPAQAKRPSQHSGPVQAPSPLASIDPMKLLQQYYPWLIASAVLGVAVGFGAFFVLKETFPRWDADVTYEVRGIAEEADDPMSGSAASVRQEMEAFMNTMVRVIESDTILGRSLEERVVRDTVWAQKFKDASGNLDGVEALRKLKKIVNARAIPDTNIIQLRVGTKHKDDAPNIANAISLVFLDDTSSRSGRDMRQLIEEFESVARQLGKDLESIDQRMEAMLSKEELTSLRQESTVQYSEVENLQPALVNMREQLTLTREQLKTYEEMLNNPSGTIYPEAIREEVERKPIIQERDATIAALKASLRASRERFGENHREVGAIKNRLDAEIAEREALVESNMKESFSAVVENLRNSVRNQEATEQQASTRLSQAEAKLRDVTQALKRHDDLASERSEKVVKKSDMEKTVSNMRLLLARGSRIRPLSTADLPKELAFPKMIPTTIMGAVAVMGLAVGLIALREIREQRVRGPHDVALIPRTRVLGVIPDLSMDPSAPEKFECVSRDRPQGVIAESIRQVRSALCKEMYGRGLRSVVFVGGLPGSGTSSVLSNLAINAAATDLRVLVIDANLRRPSLHTVFQMSDAPGLSDVLLGNATLADAARVTTIKNVSILSCGRRDIPVFERFATASMHELFQQAKQSFDLVLVDATPGVVAGDALAIAAHCDACVLVVRAMNEKRGLVARLRNQLGDTGAEFLGVIVNGVMPSAGGYFKRNFQVTHDYGREAIEPAAESGKATKSSKKPKAKGDATADVADETTDKAA